MADTNLFSRLKRLFSNDVIIRNVGGKQLKIMDTGRIQKYGNLATNSLYDRFTRLHKPHGSSLQYNPTLNYQSMRLQLYSDYEAMDHDPIIAAALDIISDESTTRNEYGDVLNINSSDENSLKKVILKRALNYDIIMEDASHSLKDQIISLFMLFKTVVPGGLFICEELDFPDTRTDMNINFHRIIKFIRNILNGDIFFSFVKTLDQFKT